MARPSSSYVASSSIPSIPTTINSSLRAEIEKLKRENQKYQQGWDDEKVRRKAAEENLQKANKALSKATKEYNIALINGRASRLLSNMAAQKQIAKLEEELKAKSKDLEQDIV